MISWSKTIEKLGLNIVAGLKNREFICPVFGITHKIEDSYEMDTNGSLYVIPYRGYHYFLRRTYDYGTEKVNWSFGLVYIKNKSLDHAIYSIIMLIADDLTSVVRYNVGGTRKIDEGTRGPSWGMVDSSV